MAIITRLDKSIKNLPVWEEKVTSEGVTVGIVCLRKKHIAVVKVGLNTYQEVVKAA